jgi:hypothetical protein
MVIFRCKMCGGDLKIQEGQSVCTCEYCGTEQTLPRLDTDRKANLYDRANHFRRNNDFDKAMSIYEQILNEDNTDSEAYWSLVLCRYGIEYVEDPATHKRIPTINRAQYTSIYADENYKSAINYASAAQKIVYENEAKTIDEIQKGILEISEKEEPFDVFICYKETDDLGRRTPDSVLANELYHQLTQEEFKVFFSRITLEDKLGQEYEPYIFAALNSAKVMVVLGTKPEYFKAVWVKNEWSRYLSLIKNGAQKMLIPAYKDMDPYDLPDEFSHLQAQDMSKLGFMQDLIRGIKKIIITEQEKQPQKETVVVQQGYSGNVTALIKRGNMALEDGEWQKADDFFEEVLNQDAECAEAYLGKLLAKIHSSNVDALIDYFDGTKATRLRLDLLNAFEEDTQHINEMAERYNVDGYLSSSDIISLYNFSTAYQSELSGRREQKKLTLDRLQEEKLLVRARKYAKGDTESSINRVIEIVTKTLDERIENAQNKDRERIENKTIKYTEFIAKKDKEVINLYNNAIAKRENRYQSIIKEFDDATSSNQVKNVKRNFENMNGYSDSTSYIQKCEDRIEQLTNEEETQRARYEAKLKREARIRSAVIIAAIALIVAVGILCNKVIIPNIKYNQAIKLMEEEKFEEAATAFGEMDGYKDSAEKKQEAIGKYQEYLWQVELVSLKNAKVGDIVEFGNYLSNTEWIVLDEKNGKKLLLSRYAFDSRQYNSTNESVTWESCTIRDWLNTKYVDIAFDKNEKTILANTEIVNNSSSEYEIENGNNTIDKIFLLSIDEVENYLSSEEDRKAFDVDGKVCSWWVRATGKISNRASYITGGGGLSNGEVYVDTKKGIRPALWIDLTNY